MRILGVPGRFGESGTPEELRGLFGLTAEGIAAAAIDLAGGGNRCKLLEIGKFHSRFYPERKWYSWQEY
jgi:pyruvate dehydrogenase complex dehydrogenase (E1) component